jgi:hypothetical protein
VGTAQRAQVPVGGGGAMQAFGPGPGGVDHGSGGQASDRAGFGVLRRHADDAAQPIAMQAGRGGVVERHRAAISGLLENPQHQAGIVGLSVLKAAGSAQPFGTHPGDQSSSGVWLQETVSTPSGDQIVDIQTGPQRRAPGFATPIDRYQKVEGVDQPRGLGQEMFAFDDSRTGQSDAALAQIPQAAVDQLGTAARGSPCKITAFEKEGRKAAAGRCQQDPGAGDAASHDDQVPTFGKVAEDRPRPFWFLRFGHFSIMLPPPGLIGAFMAYEDRMPLRCRVILNIMKTRI